MTLARRLLLTSALLTLSVAGLALSLPGIARAQPPAYKVTPPTLGALYRDGQTGRYLLGGAWLYRQDLGDVGLTQRWWRDVSSISGWSPVTVPNSYNAGDFSMLSMNGYVGWYRRDFTLPTGAFARYVPASARHWILRFESVDYSATVWLNGKLVGSHQGTYLPFEFDLSNLRAGVNRLVVRVDDRHSLTTIPPYPGMLWWNFGGLQREVYLRAVQAADIEQVQVRPLITCPTCNATVDEQVLVRNVTGSTQNLRLRGLYGTVPLNFGSVKLKAHATWTASATATIKRPRLWSIQHPTLYKATLALSDQRGRSLGGYVTYSGIRNISITGGVLELNWRQVHLRGVDLHEQNILTGAALNPAQLEQLMAWIRQLGATLIRSHYPLNPQLLEMADRYGILVWSEIPVYHVQNQLLANPAFVARAHAMLTENILTNQNHPSVLLWSIGNELATPATPEERSYIAGAAAVAHRLDPTRPVAMAISDWPGVPCQSAYGPLDAIGFNDYFGWFDAGGGTTDDRDSLSPFLDTFRSCYPKKALLVSEFGFEASQNGPVEQRGTYQFQANSAAFHLGVFATKPWLAGTIYWLLQDFAAAPGWSGGNPVPDPPFVQKGLINLEGQLKPAFAVVAQIYHSTMQIAPAGR